MSKTVFSAYNGLKEQLEKAGFPDFVFEAKQIIKHVTGLDNKGVLNNYNTPLTETQENMVTAILNQRLSHYPLQYILGVWEFYGLKFAVGPGVLIPRADTETVVETALSLLKDRHNVSVADLCAGTGCIGITVAKNKSDCAVTCLEKYEEALRYTRKNCELNGVFNIRAIKGDVLKGDGKDIYYDFIISNPPYVDESEMENLQKEVTFEPESALFGGKDGLSFYRAITENYKDVLSENGILMFEIGSGQAKAVSEILEGAGFTDITVKQDIENRDRVVFGTLKKI